MFVINLERYGNTSAASIPIALCEAIEQKRIRPNEHVAFIGFGGGLTWAAMVVKWTDSKSNEVRNTISINQQRRQMSYLLVRWRAQFRRLSRQLSDFMERIDPRRGRIRRLRDKAGQL